MEKDGAGDCVCCNARRVLKILVGAVILVCFVSVLSIGTMSSNGVVMEESVAGSIPSQHSHEKIIASNRRLRLDHHLIYVSKRRVPNGPDPIHNRRFGESRRPPGRA